MRRNNNTNPEFLREFGVPEPPFKRKGVAVIFQSTPVIPSPGKRFLRVEDRIETLMQRVTELELKMKNATAIYPVEENGLQATITRLAKAIEAQTSVSEEILNLLTGLTTSITDMDIRLQNIESKVNR